MWKRIFACKLSDDFSGFVDASKHNRAGALELGNGSIDRRVLFQNSLSPFNTFWYNHVFVFIAIYGKGFFFYYILILNW